MNSIFSNLVLTPPIVMGIVLSGFCPKVAAQVVSDPLVTHEESLPPDSISQVTSVSQLSDVQPTDWAFGALQSLVERYGVIAGYPDGTFRGHRALTRYEFAAGLNAALDRVNELIAAGSADLVSKEDLATLQRLQTEFATELTTLRGRVDNLEATTAQLEANQFSTTTQLQGEVIFLAADTFGDRANNTRADDTNDDTQTFFGYRARLSFQTSFTGKDQLTTRLAANNIPNLTTSTGTAMTRNTFDADLNRFAGGDLFLDQLIYRFLVSEKLTAWVGLRQLQPVVFAPNLNTLIGGANGATSRFSTHNPTIFRPGFDGAGAALAYKFSKQFSLSLGYIASDEQANLPDSGRGLFNGNNLALAQIIITPIPNLDLGFTYGRKYFGSDTGFNLTGGTGSAFARNPFGQNSTTSDNFGFQFNWKLSQKLNLSGWFGYTRAHQLRGGDEDATIINGAIAFAFPDLFQKGNVGGLIFGVPPKVTSNDFQAAGTQREDRDTSLHLEAFYTFKLNDHVSFTPNLYVITNPEHNARNEAIWVGAVRTTFAF